MEIKSAADVATVRARSEWFTGTVWQDPLLEAPEPARVKMVRVTFEPGARRRAEPPDEVALLVAQHVDGEATLVAHPGPGAAPVVRAEEDERGVQ